MLVHHPLALRLGQRVPGARLDERIDEEVLRRARPNNEPLFVRLIGNGWKLVDRAPCHRQVAVGNREIAAEIGAVESGLELDEGVQIFGDLPQQEVTVAANAYQAIGPQQQPAMVALERLAELDLGRCLPLGREPSPGGIELVEGVPDDLAPFRRGSLTHGSNVTRPQRPCLTHA